LSQNWILATISTYRYLFFGSLKILDRRFIWKNSLTVYRITISVTLLVQKSLLFDVLAGSIYCQPRRWIRPIGRRSGPQGTSTMQVCPSSGPIFLQKFML